MRATHLKPIPHHPHTAHQPRNDQDRLGGRRVVGEAPKTVGQSASTPGGFDCSVRDTFGTKARASTFPYPQISGTAPRFLVLFWLHHHTVSCLVDQVDYLGMASSCNNTCEGSQSLLPSHWIVPEIYPCLMKFVSQNFCQVRPVNENRRMEYHPEPPKKVGRPREKPPYFEYKPKSAHSGH